MGRATSLLLLVTVVKGHGLKGLCALATTRKAVARSVLDVWHQNVENANTAWSQATSKHVLRENASSL